MEPALWHERWQQGRIGFHLDHVNPYLPRHWSSLGVTAPARVLIPLAGKSVDLCWFAERGYEVVANEISPIAVAAFFEEQRLEPSVEEIGAGLQRWQAGRITFLCGDFMALRPGDIGPVAAVYDRAALIALTGEQRPGYVQRLAELAPSVPQLLITLEYDEGSMSGPPFPVWPEEVRAGYEGDYRVEEIERCDILADSPKFRAKGLAALEEVVYRLTPR